MSSSESESDCLSEISDAEEEKGLKPYRFEPLSTQALGKPKPRREETNFQNQIERSESPTDW